MPCLVWQSIWHYGSGHKHQTLGNYCLLIEITVFHPSPNLMGPVMFFSFPNVFKCGQRVFSLAQLLYSAYTVQCTVLYTEDSSYPNVLKYCKQYSGRSVRQNNNVTGKDDSFYPFPHGQTYCLRIIFGRANSGSSGGNRTPYLWNVAHSSIFITNYMSGAPIVLSVPIPCSDITEQRTMQPEPAG